METRIPLAFGISALVAALMVTTQAHAQAIPDGQLNSPWFTDAQLVQTQRLQRQPTETAKNVILFIGDGMGVSTLTAARILAGQRDGQPGEEGYPKRGNPILGKVAPIGSDGPSLASDDLPYTTLGYANGQGYRNPGAETNSDAGYDIAAANGRQDLTRGDTATPGFHQEALIPLGSETHAGEDVGIYSQGPAASLLTGTLEQNQVFHTMDLATDLVGKANAALGTFTRNHD